MTLEAGSSLGPYEIEESIGAGGMGEVYRARDRRLDRQVAIKVLTPAVARDAERLARFEREARLCSSLNHPNIVTIYEFAADVERNYIAMELVDGKPLRSLLTAGPVPLRKLLSVAAQTAGGMAAAHGAGIVHRDLKPENVMVTSSGAVKILDFGLARGDLRSSDATTSLHLTGDHHVMGTAAYMSPEQAAGRPVDFRSDQFSFGSILYEMASGKHPFRRATTLELLAAIHEEDPPSLAESDAGIPEPLAWIVERCLAKDPSERYASTFDLTRDLERLRDAPLGRVSGIVRRKKRLPAALIAAVVLGVAVVALVAALVLRPAAPPASPGLMHVTLQMPELATNSNESFSALALLPDGRGLVASGNGAEHSGLWIRELRSTAARPIAGTENAYAPEVSPDGRHVAFLADAKLKVVPIEGGAPRFVCDVRGEGNLSWGPDGKILFAQSDREGTSIYSVPASGGEPVRVTRLDPSRHEIFHRWPEHLPDRKHLLYIAGARPPGSPRIQHVLMVANLDGGSPRPVVHIDSRVLFQGGRLFHVRGGALLAQPFDLESMSLTGEPALIAERLFYYRPSGSAAFDVSASGMVAFNGPRGESRLTWLSREGVPGDELARGIFGREPGRFSPDGRRFAVAVFDPKEGAADIWLYDLVRGGATRLTYDEADDTRPVWSADGQSMFLRSDSGTAGGPPDVYRIDLRQPKKQLLFAGPELEEPGDASPDGRHLIVDQWTANGRDLLLFPLEAGGKPADLVRTPFEDVHGRFSPDGRLIAYASNVSGRMEVYLLPFPERGSPIQVSAGFATRPRWRGDGRELFFFARGRIMSVDVGRNASGALVVGTPHPVVRTASLTTDFEVLPDGKRFLVRSSEAGSEVHLVLNAR